MRLEQVSLNSLEAFTNQRLLKDASICKLKRGGHGVLDKKTKVKFDTSTHCLECLLDYVHINIWGPIKTASLEGHRYFVSFIDDISRRC